MKCWITSKTAPPLLYCPLKMLIPNRIFFTVACCGYTGCCCYGWKQRSCCRCYIRNHRVARGWSRKPDPQFIHIAAFPFLFFRCFLSRPLGRSLKAPEIYLFN